MTNQPSVTWITSVRTFLARLWPHPLPGGKKQMVIASIGAGLGLMMTSLISHWLLGEVNLWFVAPMGASAVLLFGLPNSPLAQPWSIVGGNLVAGVIGVTTALFVPHPALACGIAACLTIALMFQLRCLHPPSGAVALTAILGGNGVQQLGYHFILTPVLLNSVCLALLALVFNNLAGRRYPHPLAATETKASPVVIDVPITREDLHQALESGEVLDIDEDDLQQLLQRAEEIAILRQRGQMRASS
ncbi:HPP family protein [Pantoea trifolii]|jgi:CBS domain-containing membrane protein|uniref:HPP family protein n=1 Tax=Pantoea trifolii TaxID=2968030 RepID=A0ABT1VJI5_9GAMM|nr:MULTISPECIES: HPP family protein [unclassified Pantoea]MCQ8227705.1 HPP family protein [Pantoea sp. MMK2]MCQ8235878.1 HPP family protein [Pantoea sp. MMK3]